jgi:predicted nucleic acid-binding protein
MAWTPTPQHPGPDRYRAAVRCDTVLRADLLDQLLSGTLWFAPTVAVTDCRDVTDSKYLELALAARAGTVVSSDQDLRDLQPSREF